MERSVASLTYKGSVSDAIVEAQKQKKLFVVYISGDDENSTRLEHTTWVDDTVAECISKYCIFLHLMHGSIDTLQFSAIYPQKSVPSITAVGYNGVMSWQHEGYISGENFVGSIEKAWAALHFQETAVTLLTAALASKKPEPLNPSSHHVEGNTLALDIASTSAGSSTENLENRPSDDSKLLVEKMVPEPTDDKKITMPVPETSQPGTFDDVKIKGEEQTSSENTAGEVLYTVTKNVHSPTCSDDISTVPKETHALDKSCAEASPVSVEKATVCGPHSSQNTGKEENRKNEEVTEPTDCSNSVKSEDIFLSIRLPNGASLQRKFTVRDTLKYVKNYVGENQVSGVGSYDLAVPYPRRVFNEEGPNHAFQSHQFSGSGGV